MTPTSSLVKSIDAGDSVYSRGNDQKNPIITALHRYVLHRIFRSSWDLNLNILHRMKLKLASITNHKIPWIHGKKQKHHQSSRTHVAHIFCGKKSTFFPSLFGLVTTLGENGILGFLVSPAPAIH